MCPKILGTPKVSQLVSNKSLTGVWVSWWSVLFTKANHLPRTAEGGNSIIVWKPMFPMILTTFVHSLGRLWEPRRRKTQNTSEPHTGLSCPYLSTCPGSPGWPSEEGVSEDLSMSAPSQWVWSANTKRMNPTRGDMDLFVFLEKFPSCWKVKK